MSAHSKERWSLGGRAAGLVASGLLVAALGAGAGTAAVAVAPVNTGLPTISGTPQVGQVLTAGEGTWSSTPSSYAYDWMRCGTNGKGCKSVAGGTQKNYTLVAA